MKEITSKHNAKYKLWLSLLESKGIRKEGLCLVSGEKVIGELLREDSERIVEFILPPKGNSPHSTMPATRLPGELFNELDVIGTKSPLAVVQRAELPKWKSGSPLGLQLILALSDPNNLGALLRSSEAFQVQNIILTKECCSPFLPKAIRASAGSVFRLPLAAGPSIKELTVERGYGLHMDGKNIYELAWPKDMYLVLGEEGQGLPENLNLTRVKIPMAKSIDSLNAMAAASIALFSYRQRFPL